MTHPLPPSPDAPEIRWSAADAAPIEARCPVCGERGPARPLLHTPSMVDASPMTLLACPRCASTFFDPPGVHDFSEIQSDREGFYKSYVEAVAGIWEMYWPAACAARSREATLLDVGCGFGFTVDAWGRTRGEAVGVELAPYGRAGAELLGVTIHDDYLENLAALAERRFDVVYASEVLEHVPDPAAFVRLLAGYLSDAGVLCLTTPNAAFITPENEGVELLAVLCPGFHGFQLSGQRLRALLIAAGLTHVQLHESGSRLIVWGSRAPLAVPAPSEAIRAEYLGYLRTQLETRTADDVVRHGFAYRSLKEKVLTGRFDGVDAELAQLGASLRAAYGIDLRAPEATVERMRAVHEAQAYDTAFPWFLPSLFFVLGIDAKLRLGDEPAARAYFRACRESTLLLRNRFGWAYAMEALAFLPEAWLQEAVTAAVLGDPSVAVELGAALRASGTRPTPRLGGNAFTPRQIELGCVEGLSIASIFGLADELRAHLLALLAHLDATYGAWLARPLDAPEPAPGDALMPVQRLQMHMLLARACSQLGVQTERIEPLLARWDALRARFGEPTPMALAMDAEVAAVRARHSGPALQGS